MTDDVLHAGLAQLMAACDTFIDGNNGALEPFSRSTTTTTLTCQEPVEKTEDLVTRHFELVVGDHVDTGGTAIPAFERSTTPASSELQVLLLTLK